MYAFVVLVSLSLALAVVGELLDELLPVKVPSALKTTGTVLIAMGVAWGLDYSVFTAFHQDLREQWMNPVATGVVLVAFGELVRAVAGGLGISLRLGGGREAHA
ncbi:MAG: hypothetical protein QOK42_1757 [Frankiaceae bacterium]|jgi:hypothetical protein|nr:hypothetical protein [Frankiaceae bacterium]MDX6225678.1 hypothetical protein [Frankiales bacterium]MDX6275285.1 hypothetical protein [Frankiales bacterium]